MSVIDWRHLPPLSALRAFAATAQLGGFSAAARSLNVTPAAVAQQVRGLEAELGFGLVRREGRNVLLTGPGERLAAALGDGFAAIADGVAALRAGERVRGLRVTCTESFAQSLLIPRLGGFWAAHPSVPVSIDASSRIVDLVRDGFDLAIRTGSGDWPGLEVELMARNQFVLVGAPALLGTGDPDLSQLPWLLATTYPDEYAWLRAAGYATETLKVIEMDSGALARVGAVHGLGLLFATDAIVREDVQAGRLRLVPFPGLPKISYYIVTPPGARRPGVQLFVDWLRSLVRK